MAGIRIGYIALHPEFPEAPKIINALTDRLTSTVVQSSTREQMALAQCNLPINVDWTETLNLMQKYKTHLTQLNYEILPAKGGLFLTVKHPNLSRKELYEKLMELGVGTVPGVAFGIPDYIRIALCGDDAKNIGEALRRFSLIPNTKTF